jgi:hypothetical protein
VGCTFELPRLVVTPWLSFPPGFTEMFYVPNGMMAIRDDNIGIQFALDLLSYPEVFSCETAGIVRQS